MTKRKIKKRTRKTGKRRSKKSGLKHMIVTIPRENNKEKALRLARELDDVLKRC